MPGLRSRQLVWFCTALLLCSGCGAADPLPPVAAEQPLPAATGPADLDPEPLPDANVSVPSTARSRAAVERVTAELSAALERRGLRLGAPIFIRIFKHDRPASEAAFGEGGTLEVWVESRGQFALYKRYPICYFSGDLGPKRRQGDQQAPEGFYFVRPNQLNPASRFHLSFNLGYPNAYDRAHDRTGSALMVHGNCVSIGCYAMGDAAIEEIWTLLDAALRHQQPFVRVHIFPFRLTDEALGAMTEHADHAFWSNLKKGYDAFESSKVPPNVTVQGLGYAFD